MRRLHTIIALAGTAWILLPLRSSADTEELRQEWLTALADISANREHPSFSADLRRYALFPYLEAASIVAELADPERYDEAIEAADAFISANSGTAIEAGFRRDLLFALSKLQSWGDFVRFYSSEVANESRDCEYLRARVTLGQTTDLAPLVTARWLTPRRLDAACEPAFQWLRDTGILDDSLTVRRLELLLRAGQTEFARIIAARLPEERAAVYRQWSEMLDSPLDAIDGILKGGPLPAEAAALESTWARASTATPLETFARLPEILTKLGTSDEIENELLRNLALGLAWDRRAEALEVFARLDVTAHDDYSRGWLVRSALWNGEVEKARDALRSMSTQTQSNSEWTYWRARTDELLGDETGARSRYTALTGRDNYYSAIAAARLGIDVVPNEMPIEASDRSVAELAERPEFIRSRELFLLDERVMATREWNFATAMLDSAELAAAVVLASTWGWHDVAVSTATRANIYFDYALLFPRPFSGEIALAASSHGLTEELLSGLVRQESMFRADAVSSAGAIGLTQLGLTTARQTASRQAINQPSRDDLLEPATNTWLGAATLKERLSLFADQMPVALAAYNAGAAAARRWLPDAPVDSDIWIENIPYNETRDYVRRVLWNSIVYRWLAGAREPVDTAFLLGAVFAPAQSQ